MSEFKNDTFLARWLNGELSETELEAFEKSDEYAFYMKIRKGAELLDSPSFDESGILEEIKKRRSFEVNSKKPTPKLWIFSAAASILILFSFALYSVFFSTQLTKYETGVGEKQSILLPDGSEVTLNANSTLSFSTEDWKIKRELQLVGEGFFKVQKGDRFTVKTSMGDVSVLGTEFTVQELDGFFQVMCFEGSVKVLSGGEEEVLKPKRSVRRTRHSRLVRTELSKTQPSWLQNKSSFVSVPIAYVLREFQNQYDVQFKGVENIDNLAYTGGFPHGDLDLALEVFLGSLEVEYEKKGNVVLLSN
ncbi:MAG: FecR family protein [Ekhidna sp.]